MICDGFSLRVVRAIDYENDERWNYTVNLYPFNTIYFVLGGDGYVRIGEHTTPLVPGYAYLIPANTLYSCWCDSQIRKLYVEFRLDIMPGMDVFSGLGEVCGRPLSADSMLSLRGCHDSPLLADQLHFQGELLRVLSLFAGETVQAPAKEQLRFKPILQDIEQNLRSDLRLSDVAARHGWNPSTLSRSFARAFGITLKRYADHLLVNALKQELVLTDKRLIQLASEYHFCDAYYLSAYFKRLMGISPDAYRRELGQRMRSGGP